MGANNEQYTIPLAIDPKGFLTGLDQMEAGLTEITTSAKNATNSISESMTTVNKAGDAVVAKMNAGAAAAQTLSNAAKAAGTDLTKAFSADNIKTTEVQQKITQFVAKMRDAVGKPIDFKFNLDQAGVKLLVDKITQAKGEMAAFNVVLDSAKQRLSGLTVGTTAFNELNDQIKTAETFLGNLAATTEATVEPTASLRSQIRQMREELAQMELAGKAGTKEFVELSLKAGNLADQFQDTSTRVRALASDTKGFDAGITAIRGLAGAFASAQGAMALFGDQNEELQKTIAKVQGAMALLQGVQEIANVLNKDSALSIYLQTFASKARVGAIAAETVAIEGETVATVGATAATNAWTVALLANPITALIAILATLAFTVYEVASSQKAAGLSAEQFNKLLEQQKTLLEEDLAIISRRQNILEAQTNFERKNQSDIQKIKLDALKEQKRANQDQFNDVSESILKLNTKDKDYLKSLETRNKELEDLEKKRKDINAQITAESLALQKQQIDERVKLELDFLHEKQNQVTAEIEIAKAAKSYANLIENAKIAELREGQQKELALLDQGLKEKIQGFDLEQKANLLKLTNQRSSLQLEFEVADTNGKKVIGLQIANLNKQIALTNKAGEDLKRAEAELTKANEFAKNEIIRKFANERADLEFGVATTLINIQKESAAQKEELLRATAQHEIAIVERTNLDRQIKDQQIDAIEKKRDHDIADSNLEFTLKQLDIDKTSNENRLMENKRFFDISRDGQALQNLLLLKSQLAHDEAVLEALRKAGKEESDQVVINARNTVLKTQAAVTEASKGIKPVDLAELFFPDDDKGQKRFRNFMTALDEVGKAVHAYTDMVIAQYQRQVDAQKKRVSADDDAIGKLNDQLKTEQDLRQKGYANNVEGIQKLIAEKNRQRDEDVRRQDEYQKKMEKIQKAQMVADTALQAVNLATAATKIFLAASTLGPIGEVIAAASVAAMIAAFVYTKSQAFQAANTSSMAEGGIVKGKSHAQGGQKFYAPDATGGITELEEGEHVTRKRQTEKYLPLLEAINHDKLKGMDDREMFKLLSGLGVHMSNDLERKEALRESKEHTSNEINMITIGNQATPKELTSIDNNIQTIMNRSSVAVETVHEEGDYLVYKKGNFTKKVRKQR